MQWKFPKFLSRYTARVFKDPVSSSESEKLTRDYIKKKVKFVEIHSNKNATNFFSGQYRSRFQGQGMQFSDVRIYQYGDDTRHIEWRCSARTQQTYVKTFEEEREISIILALDISASNLYGSQGFTKRESLAMGLATIALSAAKNRDQVGLVLFSEDMDLYVKPKKGYRHALRVIDNILFSKSSNKKTNFKNAFQALSTIRKQNSVIVFASDFHGRLDKNLLRRLCRKNDFIAMHVKDPRELDIPSIGLVQIEDLESGKTLLLDSSSKKIREKFKEEQERKAKALRKYLISSGSDYISISTDKNPVDEVVKFFQRRKRYN